MVHETTVQNDSPAKSTADFALITGAAMGIGRAFAEALARRGNALLLVDRRGEDLPKLADELLKAGAADAKILAQDLSVRNGPHQVFDFCLENQLSITTLINNAGIGTYSPFHEQQPWRIEEIIRVNILSLITLTRLFLPEMMQRKSGTIVNVSSIAAFERSPCFAVYGGTKAFVHSFSESLQFELEGSGVYVATVCPGKTRTNFFSAAGTEFPAPPIQSAEEVVAEAMAGLSRGQRLIVTGRSNRIRIQAQQVNLRRFLASLKGGLRRVGVVS